MNYAVSTEVKRWTVLNAQTGKIDELTDKEFKSLLENGGVKLKGDYVPIKVYHHTERVWIDAIVKSEYFK